ncbi:hypothetical protein N7532_011288 [Penicillium argentinense]|uniref:Uncharacterized protein n=1 Tax=Penicillium argentinense TaxID=1131581 RepID=A0A9W9JUT6_9EURO|nr:uncharacterized protein N7532_011288 [Penicillium argentinense]KAJ5082245.1 hypothetical protein N7532_011288 [Penicillium argentinense]
MPAIDLIERDGVSTLKNGVSSLRLFIKRGNWADKNRGVILVFVIVFIVAVGIISLFGYRYWIRKKAEKESYEATD